MPALVTSRLSVQIADALETTHWARDIGEGALATLARYLECRDVAAGDEVFRQGDTARFLCILTRGSVAILKKNSGEEERELARLAAGRTFGEMALIDHEPRSAGARACERSEVLVLTEERLDALTREHPRLAMQVMRGLARLLSSRLRMTTGRLIDLL